MIGRQQLLEEVQMGLASGAITQQDLASLEPLPPGSIDTGPPHKSLRRLGAVDVMFYIAGIVLFAADMSMIAQLGDEGTLIAQLLLSLGVGAVLWVIVLVLIRRARQSSLRAGLINITLLDGSLLLISGAFILLSSTVDDSSSTAVLLWSALALLALSISHYCYDLFVRHDLVLFLAMLLGIASFPTALSGALGEDHLTLNVGILIALATAGLVAYTARIVAKLKRDRISYSRLFDAFAVFIALAAMYAGSYGDYSVIWTIALVASIIAIFYLSIVSQSRRLLGSASFFMVVTVLTVSFKYFSGSGVTVSLVVAALGLLASTAVASHINKKYFKPASPAAPISPASVALANTQTAPQPVKPTNDDII